MSILLPFNSENFNSEMKPKISGVNLTLEFENIESSLGKVAVGYCIANLTESVYRAICLREISTKKDIADTCIDYLQRAMLHFTIYEHQIYLTVRIHNDGITTKKNDKETTAYKYQMDELKNNLISTGWFWMNRLLSFMFENVADIPLWEVSSAAKEMNSLFVTSADFEKWLGISDLYFFLFCRWLIREVYNECILSRWKEPQKRDDILRATCYEVIGRACKRLAFQLLPEPVRLDITNEMSRNAQSNEEKNIREQVADCFLRKAETYWLAIDSQTKREQAKANQTARPLITTPEISENDAFAY